MPHDPQHHLFAGEEPPVIGPSLDPAAPPWPKELTHRLRVLLSMGPLHDIRQSDTRRDPALRHYDALILALKVFDLIVDGMGLDQEVDREAVGKGLAPLLMAMDEAAGVEPDTDRHAAMVDKLLASLRNEAEGRRPFAMDYQDLGEDGRVVQRRREFRLVVDHLHPTGKVVLRLSPEAVNLYLNALELDIEDAQAATEAIVQSQLARGRLDEAVHTARNARWQSIRYGEKIERLLRDTRRDLERVDWRQEVPRLLDEALSHIRLRLATERGIEQTAEERRDDLDARAQATGGDGSLDEQRARLAEILRLVKDCTLRHGRLQEKLMGARNVFLAEQARQSFSPRPARPRPNLLAEVLEPLLGLPGALAEKATTDAFPCLVGARSPSLISLDQLVAWLLRPRREPPPADVPIEAPQLSEDHLDPRRFDEKTRKIVAELLEEIDGPVPLSELLARLDGNGSTPAAAELLVLTALRAFAPDQRSTEGLRADRLGRPLRRGGFWGDDLRLRPREESASLEESS